MRYINRAVRVAMGIFFQLAEQSEARQVQCLCLTGSAGEAALTAPDGVYRLMAPDDVYGIKLRQCKLVMHVLPV